MTLLILWIGLTIGNFIFTFFYDQEWIKAFDRSYFQGIALIVVGVMT